MLKLKNIASSNQIITPAVKGLFLLVIIIVCSSSKLKNNSNTCVPKKQTQSVTSEKKHPFYISIVDIKQDAKSHNLNISVKLFTNDIEDALKKTTAKSIDLLNPKNKPEMELELMKYIEQRFAITVNLNPTKLDYIGYEKEEGVIWVYLEVKKVNQPKTLKINTRLLYDFLPLQTNIVYAEINGIKKSSKITNPDSIIEFKF